MTALPIFEGALQPYLLVVLLGFLPTEIWRVLGVVLGRRIDPEGAFLRYLRFVAAALLAGVVASLVATSPGTLASVGLATKGLALAAGVAGYFAFRRSILAGFATGEVGLLVLLQI